MNITLTAILSSVATVIRRHSDVLEITIARGRVVALSVLTGVALSSLCLTASAHPMEQYADSATPAIDAETAAATTTAATTNSAGCGRTGHHSTGVFNWTTTDGNKKTRTFLIQVPGDYNADKAYSLNFVFHGAGGNSAQSYSWGLQNVTGASENGIFIFPDGIAYKNYGVGWDDTSAGYDIPFFDNMVKDIETFFCIDNKRVFVAGFSWGGDFVTSLVCSRGNSIRAAAANSTTDEYSEISNYLTYQNLPCSSTVHPAVRFGHAIGGDSEYPAPLFANTAKLFAHLSSCATTTKAVASSTSVMSCKSYNSCSNEYIECSFNASLGHALPPNWAADTWTFFQTFK